MTTTATYDQDDDDEAVVSSTITSPTRPPPPPIPVSTPVALEDDDVRLTPLGRCIGRIMALCPKSSTSYDPEKSLVAHLFHQAACWPDATRIEREGYARERVKFCKQVQTDMAELHRRCSEADTVDMHPVAEWGVYRRHTRFGRDKQRNMHLFVDDDGVVSEVVVGGIGPVFYDLVYEATRRWLLDCEWQMSELFFGNDQVPPKDSLPVLRTIHILAAALASRATRWDDTHRDMLCARWLQKVAVDATRGYASTAMERAQRDMDAFQLLWSQAASPPLTAEQCDAATDAHASLADGLQRTFLGASPAPEVKTESVQAMNIGALVAALRTSEPRRRAAALTHWQHFYAAVTASTMHRACRLLADWTNDVDSNVFLPVIVPVASDCYDDDDEYQQNSRETQHNAPKHSIVPECHCFVMGRYRFVDGAASRRRTVAGSHPVALRILRLVSLVWELTAFACGVHAGRLASTFIAPLAACHEQETTYVLEWLRQEHSMLQFGCALKEFCGNIVDMNSALATDVDAALCEISTLSLRDVTEVVGDTASYLAVSDPRSLMAKSQEARWWTLPAEQSRTVHPLATLHHLVQSARPLITFPSELRLYERFVDDGLFVVLMALRGRREAVKRIPTPATKQQTHWREALRLLPQLRVWNPTTAPPRFCADEVKRMPEPLRTLMQTIFLQTGLCYRARVSATDRGRVVCFDAGRLAALLHPLAAS